MARVESSILVDAAPGMVRTLTDDLSNCAEFTGGRLGLMLRDAVAVTGAKIKGTLTLNEGSKPFLAEITEAGIERLVWQTTRSAVMLRGEFSARPTPEGTRLTVALETGSMGLPGSRAERDAIRQLQDMTTDYVAAIRDRLEAKAPIDLTTHQTVTA